MITIWEVPTFPSQVPEIIQQQIEQVVEQVVHVRHGTTGGDQLGCRSWDFQCIPMSFTGSVRLPVLVLGGSRKFRAGSGSSGWFRRFGVMFGVVLPDIRFHHFG